MTIKDKLKAVKEAIGHIEKQFGKGAIMALGQQQIQKEVQTIATGCPSLDRALGCGGYPCGRIVEIYGPESSGKTTLTLHAIAEAQRAGGVAAFIDAEHALDVSYAARVGVNVEELLVSQPDTGEQALDILETLVRSGAFSLVVVDSVAALVPKAEIEGEMGDTHVGLQARLMSQALRKVTGLTHRHGATVMFINQLRMKIGVTFGSPETTTGGHALKYYASVRLDIRRIGQVKVGDAIIGNRTRVKVVKNKLAPPFKTTEFDIRYGEGIDALGDLLDSAVECGVVAKNGAYYAFDDTTLAQGREKTRELLKNSAQLTEQLRLRLQSKSETGDQTSSGPSQSHDQSPPQDSSPPREHAAPGAESLQKEAPGLSGDESRADKGAKTTAAAPSPQTAPKPQTPERDGRAPAKGPQPNNPVDSAKEAPTPKPPHKTKQSSKPGTKKASSKGHAA